MFKLLVVPIGRQRQSTYQKLCQDTCKAKREITPVVIIAVTQSHLAIRLLMHTGKCPREHQYQSQQKSFRTGHSHYYARPYASLLVQDKINTFIIMVKPLQNIIVIN